MPQAMGLLDELTFLENVTLPQRLGVTASMPAIELMGQLGIAHLAERSPSKTSLGEQQRAAVARALLPAPKLVIADEPTSHQDEANAYLLIDAFAASANAGSSILLATHDTRVIDRCDVILGCERWPGCARARHTSIQQPALGRHLRQASGSTKSRGQ